MNILMNSLTHRKLNYGQIIDCVELMPTVSTLLYRAIEGMEQFL